MTVVKSYKAWRLQAVRLAPAVEIRPCGQYREGAYLAGRQVGTYYHEGTLGDDTPRGELEL